MSRPIVVNIDARTAEAVTLWLYEVEMELRFNVSPAIEFQKHIAVLMQYMARGMMPATAAQAVAELRLKG